MILRLTSFILLFLLLIPSISHALTFIVTNLNDSGEGSLRRAILESNASSGIDDEIVFLPGLTGQINLATGLMIITDDVEIIGPELDVNDQPQITINAQNNSRIFTIDDSTGTQITVDISGLKFINGKEVEGGAIRNSELLSIHSCIFEDNEADLLGGAISNSANGTIALISSSIFNSNMGLQQAGAINNAGTINEITTSEFNMNSSQFGGAIMNVNAITTISESSFVSNSSNFGGGAIINNTTIQTITKSTFTSNSGPNGNGGAVSNNGMVNVITDSTFNTNTSGLDGAALYNQGTVGDVINTTFYDNTTSNFGGAIFNGTFADINISFATIANNTATTQIGGGIYNLGGVEIINSIVANNINNDCAIFGSFDNLGGNFDVDGTCSGFTTVTSDEINLDPTGLKNDGGPTETLALCTGENEPSTGCQDNMSAAIDAATSCDDAKDNTVSTDQRLFGRPYPSGSECDSGAFESQPTGLITIEKSTDPESQEFFEFSGTSFTEGCPLEGTFFLRDSESVSCVLPLGEYTVTENVPDNFELEIACVPSIAVTAPSVTIDIEENDEITCTFTNSEIFLLDVMIEGSGFGTVTSEDGFIDCEPDCIADYLTGSMVELTAIPNINSFFSGWSGNDSCTGLNPDLTITMDESKVCKARFTEDPVITVDKSGNGNGTITSTPSGINCGTDCASENSEFPEGSEVTLTAVPDQLSRFVEWTGDTSDCNSDSDTISVFADFSKTCTARFALLPEIALVNRKPVNRGFFLMGKQNRIKINYVSPEKTAALVWAFKKGSGNITTKKCGNIPLGVVPYQILAKFKANIMGMINKTFFVPKTSENSAFFQVVDLNICEAGPVYQITLAN